MSTPVNNSSAKTQFNAEVLYASLLEAGHNPNTIKIYNRGGFKKSYTFDVDNIEVSELEEKLNFEITLNRDGIYDKLPEGLFHQTKGSNKVNSVQSAVEEHKQYKEEEKQARKFFTPLEQMLFQYCAATEETERNALYDIQNGKLNESFYDFWNLSTSLPTEPLNRLLQVMPSIFFIKGDREATASAFSYILHKKVDIKNSEFLISDIIKRKNVSELRLGMDAVLGETCKEKSPYWECTIFNVEDSELEQFAEGKPMMKLLNRLNEIFVPIDIDLMFDILPSKETKKETYENILGVGCYL